GNAISSKQDSDGGTDFRDYRTDKVAPSVPELSSADAVSQTQINLFWEPSLDKGVAGLQGYKIYRNGHFLKEVHMSTTMTSDLNLAASTAYKYQVSAIDTVGNESALSAPLTATTYDVGVVSSASLPAPPSMPLIGKALNPGRVWDIALSADNNYAYL